MRHYLAIAGCFEIKSSRFEGICLLLNCVANHFPESLRHGETQVSCCDLIAIYDSALENLALLEESLLIVLDVLYGVIFAASSGDHRKVA